MSIHEVNGRGEGAWRVSAAPSAIKHNIGLKHASSNSLSLKEMPQYPHSNSSFVTDMTLDEMVSSNSFCHDNRMTSSADISEEQLSSNLGYLPESLDNLPSDAVDVNAEFNKELELKNAELEKSMHMYVEQNQQLHQKISEMQEFIYNAQQETVKDMGVYIDTMEYLEKDFVETNEALDRAHNKIRADIEDFRKLFEENEAKADENAKLRDKEKALQEKLEKLKEELREQEEREEERKENSGFMMFWKNAPPPSKLEECQSRIKDLEVAVKTAHKERIESKRALANARLKLQKSEEFINKQLKIISDLETSVKRKNRLQELLKSDDEESVSLRGSNKEIVMIEKSISNLDVMYKEQEIAELERKLKDNEEEKEKLKHTIEKLKRKLEDQRKHSYTGDRGSIENLKSKINEKSRQVEKLSKENKNLRLQVAELGQSSANSFHQREELKHNFCKLEHMQSEINALEAEKRLKEEELEGVMKELNTIAIENEELKGKLYSSQEMDSIIEQETKEDDLAKENEALQTKINELQKSWYFKVEENIGLMKSLNEMQGNIDRMVKEKEEFYLKFKDYSAKQKSDQERFEKLREDAAVEKRHLEERIISLKAGQSDNTAIFERISHELSNLQRQVDTYMPSSGDYFQPEVDFKPQQYDVDISSVPDSDYTSTTVISEADTLPLDGASRVSRFQQQSFISQATSTELSLKPKAGELKIYSATSQPPLKQPKGRQNGRIGTLDKNKFAEQEYIRQISNQISDMKTKFGRLFNILENYECEKDVLQTELNVLKTSDARYYSVNNKLIQENKEVKKDLEDLQTELRILKSSDTLHHSTSMKVSEENKEMRNELRIAKQQVEDLEASKNKLQERVNDLTSKLSEIQRNLDDEKIKNQTQNAELDELRNKALELAQEHSNRKLEAVKTDQPVPKATLPPVVKNELGVEHHKQMSPLPPPPISSTSRRPRVADLVQLLDGKIGRGRGQQSQSRNVSPRNRPRGKKNLPYLIRHNLVCDGARESTGSSLGWHNLMSDVRETKSN